MKAIIQGRKKTSIEQKGNTTHFSSMLEYECRKQINNEEAEKAAGDMGDQFESESNKTQEEEKVKEESTKLFAEKNLNVEKKLTDKELFKSPPPAIPLSAALPKTYSVHEAAEIIWEAKPKATTSKRKLSPLLLVEKKVLRKNVEVQCDFDENDDNEVDISFDEIRKIYLEVNKVFEKRVNDVKANVPQDFELQIKTYQEWCENLIKCNSAITASVKTLKNEIKNFDSPPTVLNEIDLKFEHDRDSLTKFVQERFHKGKWNFKSLELKSLPYKEILNVDSDYSSEAADCPQQPHNDRSKERKKSLFTKPKN